MGKTKPAFIPKEYWPDALRATGDKRTFEKNIDGIFALATALAFTDNGEIREIARDVGKIAHDQNPKLDPDMCDEKILEFLHEMKKVGMRARARLKKQIKKHRLGK